MSILGGAKSLEDLEMEKQRVTSEQEIAEKRALIAEAKKRYGNDWKSNFTKFVGNTKSGIDWSAIKFRCK